MHPHNIFWFMMATSIVSCIACTFIGKRKQMGPLMGAAIGFAFGVLAFTFIFFLPGKKPNGEFGKLKRYKTMFEEGLISRSEYLNLTGVLSEERF